MPLSPPAGLASRHPPPRLAAASPSVRFLFGAVPMWNLIVLYPIVVPRIIIAVNHDKLK